MQINLSETHNQELTQAAHFCSLPPEKLAQLFVEDGLALYRSGEHEFRGTLNGETE